MLCLAGISVATAQQTVPSWPEQTRETKAGSRWWWMGSAVDKENLEWSLEQLSKAGIGTLEITPIYGVKGNASKNIPFLSTQWLDMLRYCREQGNNWNIDIDMTTGTGWPFGGPMVKPAESASKLVTETFDIAADGTAENAVTLNTANGQLQCVIAFPQKGTEAGVADLTALVDGKTLAWTAPTAGKWKVIAAYCQQGVMQVKRPSPGSEGLVLDYFDREAVANYLKYFDQKFEADAAQGDLQSPWPHSFFNDSYEINQADWTRSLLTEFEQRRGYRLQDYLDLLLGLTGTYRPADDTRTKADVYSDYRQTLSDMLTENFTRQWTQWAHSHGATTRNQAHGSPGNLIDLYAEADIPETENFYMNSFGIRGLRDDKGFYNKALSSRATLKYASSAAHITGKPLTSSESMTWLTEHFRTSLSQIKPELDLLFTSGVNHVLFHGTAYSPKDAPWPGWKFYAAIDMSPTNSIWRDAPFMMQYIERVQSFLQMGQPDNDVLVYAPFANAWRKTTGSFLNRLLLFDINAMGTKMSELEQCVNNLEALGLDCDYTSERYLMTTTCNDGQLVTAAGTTYKAIVVPVSDNLPDSIKTHLDNLAAQGAQVVYGRDATALSALTARGDLQTPTPEAMRTEMGLSVIRRKNATGHHYFIANLTSNDAEGYVPLAVDFQDAVFFDPMTGGIAKAPVTDGNIWLSLKSGQSLLLQTYATAATVPGGFAAWAAAPAAPAATVPGGFAAGATVSAAGTAAPAATVPGGFAAGATAPAGTAVPVKELAALTIGDEWTFFFDDATLLDKRYKLERPHTWETLSEESASYMGTGIYETTFTVTAQQMKTATAGFRLDLGDVRESARVYLNGEYLGCAWAVPFVLDCGSLIREGRNTLNIEVTNLPANRIRQMDIDGTEWRIFEDINMSNISTATYDKWDLVPSGLNSKVRLIPMACQDDALKAEMTCLVRSGDFYYPQFAVSGSKALEKLSLKTQDGQDFTGYDTTVNADGSVTLTVKGDAQGLVIVESTADDGTVSHAYVPAYGAYDMTRCVDLTAEEEPLGGWQKLSSTSEIKGFSGTGKLPWYRSKANGKSVTLYDGLTFQSDASNYYFYFLGYGMNTTNDFRLVPDEAVAGELLAAAYLQGTGDDTYNAADSLLCFALCEDAIQDNADGAFCLPLTGNKSMTVYRSLFVYTPADSSVGIEEVADNHQHDSTDGHSYTLQGIRTSRPTRGLYIQNHRIVRHK